MIVHGPHTRRGDVATPHLWHILGMVMIVGEDPVDENVVNPMWGLPETWEFLGLDGSSLERETY